MYEVKSAQTPTHLLRLDGLSRVRLRDRRLWYLADRTVLDFSTYTRRIDDFRRARGESLSSQQCDLLMRAIVTLGC